ncbi:MAG: T9SS type A sorting domain-containing protein [Sphingobacteriaceae bacterium]|nr:T9SS type A sorting domain-containing protein [Sphingobacteriaceae bacterium]
MKFYLTLGLIAICSVLRAQTLRITTQTINGVTKTDSLWYTDQEYVNHVFGNLNFQQVTTNFLLDRSSNQFDPLAFDGKDSDNFTVKSSAHSSAIYNAFYYSALDTGAAYAPTHPKQVAGAIQAIWDQGQVPIGLINHSYNSIRPDAASLGLFTTNADTTVLYDNVNRTLSPYRRHRLFSALPYFKDGKYSSSGDVVFNIFPADINVTDTIAGQIQIDFGDGLGFVNVNGGMIKTIFYSTSGIKTIKVRQGGLEAVCEFEFTKEELFYNLKPLPYPPEESNNIAKSLNKNASPGTIAEVDMSCDNTFDKPILIIEGFNIDREFTSKSLIQTINGKGLRDQLSALGYDFVTVRFTNNKASIIENAHALQLLIADINTIKAGDNKLNIIGLSMGGLIAKYCLKDMEDKSLVHNVANYFSYDAPHQGAYIPLGLQYLLTEGPSALSQFGRNPQVADLVSKLQSEAGFQLLQQHVNGVGNNGRNAFAAAYASKGYPVQCHNYGIANGRGDGVGLGYPDGAQMINLKASKVEFINLFTHQQELYATSSNDNTISYMRNSGVATWIFASKGVYKYKSRITFDGELSHESVPGSVVPFAGIYGQQLKATFEAQKNPKLDVEFSDFGRQLTTFVPTASALDLNNQNYGQNGHYYSQNPYYNLVANQATQLSKTPFDDIIYSASGNHGHLEMTAEISDFIFKKIYGSPMPTTCAGICAPIAEFSGLSNLCNVTDPTVTFNNMPSGVIVNWVMPNGLQIQSGQGTNSIKINHAPTGTYSGGYVTLLRPGCPSASYSFTVEFTEPSLVAGATDLCGTGVYSIPNLPNGATVTWELTGTAAEITENHNSYVVLNGLEYGQAKLKATVVSSCGTHVVESPNINYGFPYYITLTDVFNDGMGTAQGYLCSDTRANDNYFNTFSYTIPAEANAVTLHYQIYGQAGLVYSNEVTVTGSGTQRLPDSLPNGTYTLDVWISGGACNISTEMSEVEIIYQSCNPAKIAIYPNPASSEIKISSTGGVNATARSMSSDNQGFSVKLFSDKGSMVKEAKTDWQNPQEILLQVSDLKNGTYFLHVFKGKDVIKKQIIISH